MERIRRRLQHFGRVTIRTPQKRGRALRTVFRSLAIVAVSVLFVSALLVLKPKPEAKPIPQILPLVEVLRAHRSEHRLEVVTHGTVQPRTETNLTSEVSGVIVEVSSKFFPGKFFEEDEVLLQVDATEYRALHANAKSRLAQAQLVLEQENALAEQALKDWKALGRGQEGASGLVLREPQLVLARADIEAARASLELAERNLRLTTIRAPYGGRVREKFVDIGQVLLARVTLMARIYSVDVAEVRLPISAREAGYIAMLEIYANDAAASEKPQVILEFDYAGRRISWEGFIDRMEGVIDATTRQMIAVAQVLNPYARDELSGRPPLKAGQFVKARIQGHLLKDAMIIPRGALHDESVYLISENNRLEIRRVEVARKGIETVVLESGLNEGDQICLTPLEFAIEGMEVIVESVYDDLRSR